MKTLKTLNATLSDKNEKLSALNFDLDDAQSVFSRIGDDPLATFEDEITSEYEQQLDEDYEEALSGVDFLRRFTASELMKDCDLVGYTEGLRNFADGRDITDYAAYKEAEEVVQDLESEIEDLESEIEDLESEIEDLESE